MNSSSVSWHCLTMLRRVPGAKSLRCTGTTTRRSGRSGCRRLWWLPLTWCTCLDVVHLEAAALEGAQDIEARARRQPPAHAITSLTLTGSARGAADVSLSGIGRPSFCRLSR
jgi:hypothetical protein